MVPISRTALRVVVCVCAALGVPAVAHAQAIDGFNPAANQTVSALAVQPDGKILVGGGFTGLGGTTRNHLARLNADGSADGTFNPGANSIVQAIAVQPDGKILIGGNFTSVGGGTGLTTPRSYIARINPDGTVDASFNPGASLTVYAIIVQADGKILVGGEFSRMGGGGSGSTTRNRLARLNPDGSLDSFDPGASKPGASAIIYTMAQQPDGKIVVGGYFNGLGGGNGGTVRNYIGRINADGTLDAGFNPGATFMVNALVLQPDGKIVVGGDFTGLGGGGGTAPAGVARGNIGRLNADGSVDISFNPGAESQVLTLGLQIDGKILAGGYFKWLGGQGGPSRSTRNYIGRINADGSVDGSFNPGAGNVVNAVAQQADGSIVIGGLFGTLGGGTGTATPRSFIGRIANTDAANQSLTLTNGGTIETWLRSGSGPEVSRVTFEFSFDNSFYSLLGSGIRISGGWQLNSVNLPARSYIRARGYYGSGFQSGSASIVESILQPSGTLGPPVNFTASAAGSAVTLSWGAPSTGTPTAYIIEAGTGPGAANLANFSTGSATTTYSASGIASGVYYVRVRATDSVVTSAPSNEAILTVGGSCAPSAPAGLTASVNGSFVAVQWSGSSGSLSYLLEVGSAPGLSNVFLLEVGTTSVSGNVAATTYYVRVRARNACGTSGPSNEVQFTVN